MRGAIDARLASAPGGSTAPNPMPRPILPTSPHHIFVGSMGTMGSMGPERPLRHRAPTGGRFAPGRHGAVGPGAGPAPIHRPRGGDLVRRGDGMISDLRTLGASWTFHCDLSDRGRLIVSLRRPLPAGLPADRPDRIARNGPVQDRPGGRPQSVPRFAMRPDPWPPPVRLVLIAHPVRPRSHPGGPTPAVRSGQGRPTPARARPTVWPGAVGGSSYHEIRRPTEVPADPYRPDGG